MENNHVNKRVWAVSIGLLMVLATVPSMQAEPVEVVEETADEVLVETGMDSCASATNDTIQDGGAPDNATATCREGVTSNLQDASSRQQQIVCGVNSPPSCWVELVMEAACGENGDCVEVGPCDNGEIGVVWGEKEFCTESNPSECDDGETGVSPACIDPDPDQCPEEQVGIPPLCVNAPGLEYSMTAATWADAGCTVSEKDNGEHFLTLYAHAWARLSHTHSALAAYSGDTIVSWSLDQERVFHETVWQPNPVPVGPGDLIARSDLEQHLHALRPTDSDDHRWYRADAYAQAQGYGRSAFGFDDDADESWDDAICYPPMEMADGDVGLLLEAVGDLVPLP